MEYPKGYVRYIFLPENSPAEIGSAALQFIFGDVPVNDQIGTAEIDLTEVSTKCIQPNCPVQPLDVTKLGPGWGEVSFSAKPTIVTIGRSTTLSWDGSRGRDLRDPVLRAVHRHRDHSRSRLPGDLSRPQPAGDGAGLFDGVHAQCDRYRR